MIPRWLTLSHALRATKFWASPPAGAVGVDAACVGLYYQRTGGARWQDASGRPARPPEGVTPAILAAPMEGLLAQEARRAWLCPSLHARPATTGWCIARRDRTTGESEWLRADGTWGEGVALCEDTAGEAYAAAILAAVPHQGKITPST